MLKPLLLLLYCKLIISLPVDSIPGRFIAVLKQEATSKQLSNIVEEIQLNGSQNGKYTHIHYVYDVPGGFKGFAGNLDTSSLNLLRSKPELALIERDGVLRTSSIQKQPPWGLARIGSNKVANVDFSQYAYPDSAGEGVTVYVIDSGCNPNLSEFEGRATLGKAFGGAYSSLDESGHGTHIAATIAGKQFGVAKKAKLVCVRTSNGTDDESNYSDLIAAIEWAALDALGKKAVANLSMATERPKVTVDMAVVSAIKSGLNFVVAAGNYNDEAIYSSPGRVRTAITVAAATKDHRHAEFSNYGGGVDIYAPGINITSAWFDGTTKVMSGTSMAAPHVTGVAALYLALNSSLTGEDLKKAIINNGIPNVIRDSPPGTRNVMAHAFYRKT